MHLPADVALGRVRHEHVPIGAGQCNAQAMTSLDAHRGGHETEGDTGDLVLGQGQGIGAQEAVPWA